MWVSGTVTGTVRGGEVVRFSFVKLNFMARGVLILDSRVWVFAVYNRDREGMRYNGMISSDLVGLGFVTFEALEVEKGDPDVYGTGMGPSFG